VDKLCIPNIGWDAFLVNKFSKPMKEEEIFEKSKSVKGLILSMAAYSSGSILGPLLLLGVLGFFIDKIFNTKPLFLLIGIFVAFIVTNIMIYKKTKQLSQKFDKYLENEVIDKDNKKDESSYVEVSADKVK
jgi:F0F1-type ATP synthase assembly protein I